MPMEVDLWNYEDANELQFDDGQLTRELVVYSRDWTVETLISQVSQGNIQVDPAFQRRHVWTDAKRSALIESLLLKFPVPQIVIAEHPRKEKSYIVIDGKQRVSTLAALLLENHRSAWDRPALSGLRILKDMNGVPLDDIINKPEHADAKRHLLNSDIRTTILTNYKDERLLYAIFYRLNSSSTPLSSQELRHALSPGGFASFLGSQTQVENPLWRALGLAEPDARLRDAELLLRLISLLLFAEEYRGNLRVFLDHTLVSLNNAWASEQAQIVSATARIMGAVEAAIAVFGQDLGRKFVDDRYEGQFNRAVFEVQVYTLIDSTIRAAVLAKSAQTKNAFQILCAGDDAFRDSVESTTKSVEKFRIRFEKYCEMLSSVVNTNVVGPRFKSK